jgi:pimeloyl-ACP methyl ester carboxylesterase
VNKSTITLSNGTSIAYLERPGGTQPLVLLHGITDNARTYEPLLAGIDSRCRVLAMDFRGHGDSDKPETRYDAEAYADDVRCFVSELTGGPALLAGHSLGGVVAVQVGATAPELVSALLLEDPPLYFVNGIDEVYQGLFNGMVMMARSLQDGSRSADDWFEVMAAAPDPYTGKPGIETMGEARIRERLASIAMLKPKALEDALGDSLAWDTDAVLERLHSPVTMLTGNPELGAVVTAEESERVAGIVDGSRLVNVADVGHLIHDQRPRQWLACVNAWIEANAG